MSENAMNQDAVKLFVTQSKLFVFFYKFFRTAFNNNDFLSVRH